MPARDRFRRTLLWILGLCLAGVAWKALWRFGPGLLDRGPGAAALWEPQARALLRANLGGPRRLWASVPPPERGTSAEAQLRLMELWDGRTWTAKAVGTGRVEGRILRVPAGRLEPLSGLAVSAERIEAGKATCRIDYRLRWDWPDPDRDLLRVASIIGLRLPAPAGFTAPGQEAGQTLVLQRNGWNWEPRKDPGDPGRDPSWPWLAWLF